MAARAELDQRWRRRDRQDIELNLQAEIANAGLSLGDGYRILLQNDGQTQEALKRFPEAAQLFEKAALRKLAGQAVAGTVRREGRQGSTREARDRPAPRRRRASG